MTHLDNWDELSNESLGRLAAIGIERHQPDPYYRYRWDQLICKARARYLLSDDVWAEYVKEVAAVTLTARHEVRQGDPLPLLITCTDPREKDRDEYLLVAIECAVIEIDGRKVFDGPPEFGECTERGSWSGSIEADHLRGLGPGAHRIRMTLPMWKVGNWKASTDDERLVVFGDVAIEADFTVLPADKPTVRAVRGTDRMKVMRTCISVSRQATNEISVYMGSLSQSVAFLASIRTEGRVQKVRRIACAAKMYQKHLLSGFVVRDATDDEEDEPIDVILTADAEAAVRSVHVTDYWDGELIFKLVR